MMKLSPGNGVKTSLYPSISSSLGSFNDLVVAYASAPKTILTPNSLPKEELKVL